MHVLDPHHGGLEKGGAGLGRNDLVGFAKQAAPLGVPNLDVAAAELGQQGGRHLAGPVPGVVSGQILGSDGDPAAREDVRDSGQGWKGRQHEELNVRGSA